MNKLNENNNNNGSTLQTLKTLTLPVGVQISLKFFKENKVKTNQGSLS